MSLTGVVDFTKDKRYLVTASETGEVNTCRFTAERSPEMADDFETGFKG